MRPFVCLAGAVLAGVLGTPPGAATAASGGAAAAAANRGDHKSGLVVRTDKGDVRGVRADGVDSFLGIRYAAAPVGVLRWRPPHPAAPWGGVAEATAYGDRCAAAASSNGPRTEAEDCLFVNVQRPTGLKPSDRRPVYVFIHGGGLVNGSANQADMAAIVRRTGVVGVSFNYRLGVLGFLGHAGLTAEAGESGNYGLMDQQAALGWITRNIAAFGGDPRRVTVGGESAGGWSVCAHLVAPGSRGLLSKAMIQSGSCISRTQQEAETAGTSFAPAVGCGAAATAVDCLRRTEVARLIDTPAGRFGFVRETPTLPADPAEAVASGQFARVPIVIGANRDEGRTFAQGFIDATRQPTWAYEFAHRTGPGLTPIPGYMWGAGHAAELAYLFPSFDNGVPIAPTFDAAERQLATDMKRYWAAFARYGTPNARGLAWWPRYDHPGESMSLRAGGESRPMSDAQFVAEHQCAFWPP
ncbi:carboxylesterase/lipase family protein [Phytohabitans rumicis]|uniref:Carboxylic ester hydrolase n=1 Tax=Phytohabitans rumicis TaxID=1076125 RepID=A0A6V8L035_9ACTN|nr:carboxylesterase family protein [Phytohabitans rumicis]GFJ87447.1 hypothetical protein Prum_010890 [Phytohabitans rumicis]